MEKLPRISVAGTGYVGLVTAAIFADRGFETITLDINEGRVNSVNHGEPFFFEPNLKPLLKRVVLENNNLSASTKIVDKIRATDITFICVGTPSKEDGSCDLKYVKLSAKQIGQALAQKEDYHLVVAKSTIIPGTTRSLVKETIELESGKTAGEDFGLCMAPEFLREGKSIFDTLYPDRIIIGQFDNASGEKLESIFRKLYGSENDQFTKRWEEIYGKKIILPKTLRVSLEEAECIKYANNSFLATKISFINEFANICERVPGVDINKVAQGIGLDHRINAQFLRAGAGFGGSCFPKDVIAIIHFAKSKGYPPKILQSTIETNKQQAKRMVELAEEKVGNLKGKKVAILGLSFKPETNDMRHAPSIKIIRDLLDKKASVIAFDPQAMDEAKEMKELGEGITYASTPQECLKDADVCLLVTEWDEFKELQPKDFKQMKTPVLIDGRRIYDYQNFLAQGVDYAGIGLGLKEE
ncbi:MAG: nucleotide sugar dehydrogenase [Candidatus Heimdallarchaeota archaeon]|nr:nucleotide sugar dehydrogenase [Candidatus Heimdallarchaeota archaeon]